MEQDAQLNDYRTQLLDALREYPARRRLETPGQLQVSVDHERVGSLDCAGSDPTFAFASRERIIHQLEVRTEDGVLIGGLCAPEFGMRTARFAVSHHVVEVTVHNRSEGGSVKVAFKAAPALWNRLQVVAGTLSAGLRGFKTGAPAWSRALAATQIAVAVVVLLLLTDRLTGLSVSPSSQTEAYPDIVIQSVSRDDLRPLEERLSELAQTQTLALKAMQAQQQDISQLHRTVGTVARTQQQLTTGLLTVQKEATVRKKGTARDVEVLTRMLMSKAETEREQLREELRSLTTANDALTKEVTSLATNNQELKTRLKTASAEVSKPTAAKTKDHAVAEKAKEVSASPQVADARRENPVEPFTFWVSFQDNTSEKNIEDLLHEIHGRKGPLNAGWYPVEVTLPQPQPPDQFLESIRHAKIVKAVAKTQSAPAGQ